MIRFRCIYCGQKIRTADENLGKEAKCPTCGHPIRIVKRPLATVSKAEDESKESKTKNKVYVNSLTDEQIAVRYLNANPEDDNKSIPVRLIEKVIVPTAYQDKNDPRRQIPHWIKRAFVPTYNRLSLFIMGICMFMLLVIDSRFHSDILKYFLRYEPKADILDFIISNIRGWIFLFLLFVGMILCIYQVFISKPRSNFQKWVMLYFAVFVNGLTGVIAGYYILFNVKDRSNVWLYIFPLWNIFNGAILLDLYRIGGLTPKDIIDDKVSIPQIIIGTLIAATVFLMCHYIFKLYWAITYSICVIYATGFSRAVQKILCPTEKEL